MNQQTAKNILLFLSRVQIQGSEAIALIEAMNAINELLTPNVATAPTGTA